MILIWRTKPGAYDHWKKVITGGQSCRLGIDYASYEDWHKLSKRDRLRTNRLADTTRPKIKQKGGLA